MTEDNYDGITRIKDVQTPGWLVVLGRDGKEYSRYFADIKYGSRDKALDHALIYRDVLAGMLGATGEALRHLVQPAPQLSGSDEKHGDE